MVDFLIVKRAMHLNGSDRVELSTVDEAFTQAVREFVEWAEADEHHSSAWFNPFGTARTIELGYRTEKYLSNGTAVTVPRWTDLTTIVGRERARIIEFREGDEDRLATFLLGRSDAPRPRLVDAATWFYRSTELEVALVGELTEAALVEAFSSAVGLTETEVGVLFDAAADAPDEPEEDSGA
jgi:hypothetical protein